MTGMVREYLGVSPFYLNLRYTYELSRPTKWLHSKKKKPLPFIFVVPDTSSPSSSRLGNRSMTGPQIFIYIFAEAGAPW